MNYALAARKELESQIALSLNKLGIYKDSIKKANIVGDYTIIEGTEETFPKRVYELRTPILTQVKENGFDQVVEEFAYTWFNRIIALRFMEVHDYFDHGFRVLSSRDGSYEPEVLKNVSYVIDYLKLDRNVVTSLHDQGKTEELYRYILFKQCNALSNTLPMLFDAQESYMELLLPNNLLSKGSVIRQIEEIPEEDFLNDVEVIGWLYQFYNSVKKDQVFASKETITKDTLPAVTQLFTPDWIVRYMAQNSIGRIWLESYPDSPLKSQMKYYVEDAKQEEDVQKKLDAIKYKNVNPEELRIIEPCCGSGHILVYVFDLLLEMYKEKGYNLKDIPEKILSKNLYGLDVDKRAAQLSQFSLMMKARSIDNRFFSDNRRVIPQVYEIQDSKLLIGLNYKQNLIDFGFSKKTRDVVNYLVETFEEGKVIGSLLKVESKDYQSVIDKVEKIKNIYVANLLQMEFLNYGIKRIEELSVLASILSSKFDVMITNPPYCGISGLEQVAKKYFQKNYPDSKTDMFSMFMDTSLIKINGYMALINMHAWMFINSYLQLRIKLINNFSLLSLVHLGIKAFEMIGNDIVQTCAVVFKNKKINNFKSTFIRLVNFKDYLLKQSEFFNKDLYYYISSDYFLSSPSKQYSYWVPNEYFMNFDRCSFLEDCGDFTGAKNITGDNKKYVRYFWEVNKNNIKKDYWVPYAKGGLFRKYYGNIINVVDWRSSARHFYETNKTSNLLNHKYWYKEGITYNAVTSRGTGFRYFPSDCLFDYGGPVINVRHELIPEVLGLLNSKIADYYFKAMNPSVNLQTKDIKTLPIIISNDEEISNLVKSQMELAKKDWNESETSLDFEKNPLVTVGEHKLSELFKKYKSDKEEDYKLFESNENRINELFANLYNMHFVKLDLERRDISVKDVDLEGAIQSLILYLIGCLMGRYSLEQNGVVYADEKGEGFDSTKYDSFVDEDGIIPIYNFAYIEDGLTSKIIFLVRNIYGTNHLNENLDFIVSALNASNEKTAEENLNEYINNNFFNYQLKTFRSVTSQAAPIYWMFSSGKHGAFKCLVYMHRYNKDTLARINTKYFLPRTAMYKSEHSRLEGLLETATNARQKKNYQKQLDEVIACEKELFEYGQVLDHMANQFIDIDLDNGVKVNYDKFQNGELIVDGATIKKPLLVPIK